RFKDYLFDKILILIINAFGMIFLSLFLLSTGTLSGNIILILLVWLFVVCAYFGLDFFRRRRYFTQLTNVLDSLDKRYLIGEVMEGSFKTEDRLYRDVIRRSNKAVIEKINQLENAENDYREYIESWIHEVKAPLTTLYLLSENNKDELSRNILLELKKLENYVDSALFYARSDNVYQDFVIKQTDLRKAVVKVIQNEKLFFTTRNFSVEIADYDDIVNTDEKWFQFILKQILLNAVKYRRGGSGLIKISTEKTDDAVKLIIEDNGIGILENEIARVFDKSFTGSNGRRNTENKERAGLSQESTGMGLYLCKKLSEKIGIGIEIRSEFGEFTKVILAFPKSNFFYSN
ncbi:MAG: sensor histidine kinase, partial [Lachnospiraceae bacterium]|nr:sensor histidine kinase [Lachnospiraceae bacterium]